MFISSAILKQEYIFGISFVDINQKFFDVQWVYGCLGEGGHLWY